MIVKGFFDEISMYEAIVSRWHIDDKNLRITVREGVYLDDHPLRDKYGEQLPGCILGFNKVSFSKRIIYTKGCPKGNVVYDESITWKEKKNSLDGLDIGEFMDVKNAYYIEGHIDGSGEQIVWFISADGFYIDVM